MRRAKKKPVSIKKKRGGNTHSESVAEIAKPATEKAADDFLVIEGLRDALRRSTAALARAKASKEDLVNAVYRAASDSALAYPPVPGWSRPSKKRNRDSEWASIHLTDWQNGKALADTTPVLTTTGWKMHGDIRKGDSVYGPDGLPKVVIAVTGSTKMECSRVVFDGGAEIVASNDHLWRGWRRYKSASGTYGRRPIELTTEEISNLKPTIRGNRSYVERGFHVELTKPLELRDTGHRPINPHLLGCWLGDGSQDKGEIAMSKDDAAELFNPDWIGFYPSRADLPYIRVPGLKDSLKAMGLLGNKHIPRSYLMAPIQDRIDLIRGLMDTDGTVSKSGGSCSFTNTNKTLIDGLVFLLASLGVKSSVRQRQGRLYGVAKKLAWSVSFNPPFHAFRLRRKFSLQTIDRSSQLDHRFVQKVIPCGMVSAQCLTVDGEMYLAGPELIATHNCTRSYSSKVCERRVNEIADKTLDITEIQRSDHPVDSCAILLGGDMIEGTTIFSAQAWEVDAGLSDQIFNTAALIDKFVRTMLQNFDHVEVWEEYGNHGRHGRFGEQPSFDNFDLVSYRIARERLESAGYGDRLVWHKSDNFYIIGNIGAYKFLLVHGDEIKSFGGSTPAFGIMRKVTAWASGVLESFSDCYMGHFHRNDVFALPNGGRVFMGGTLESGSEYAREFCAATGSPSQRLNFIDPVAGMVTAEYVLWIS